MCAAPPPLARLRVRPLQAERALRRRPAHSEGAHTVLPAQCGDCLPIVLDQCNHRRHTRSPTQPSYQHHSVRDARSLLLALFLVVLATVGWLTLRARLRKA